MDSSSTSGSVAAAALRWLARGVRGAGRVAGDTRTARIVEHARRAGRLRLALLAEELATAVAKPEVPREALLGAPVPRPVGVVLSEVAVFRKRLGMSPWPLDVDDHAGLRAVCRACVDELVAVDGPSSRLLLLEAHVALCAGRACDVVERLDAAEASGVYAGRVWSLRVRARLALDDEPAARALASGALDARPFDPWLAVLAALIGTRTDDRALSSRAYARVRALGPRAHAAAHRAAPILTARGWSAGAIREAFGTA